MPRSESLRQEITRIESRVASLTKEQAKHQETVNKSTSIATKKRAEASRTRSESTRRTATTAAEREEKNATTALKKVSDTQAKIVTANKSIASKQSSLTTAQRDEQRAHDRDTANRMRKEKAESQRRDREDARKRKVEKDHAREVKRLANPTASIRYIEVQPPKPEPLRVLYLTANPESEETATLYPDGTVETKGVWLRVDHEMRQVKDMLKRTKYRDLVTIEHLTAATSMDLINGLNEIRPHVVHFSGHSSELGLRMENEQGTSDGDDLDFALLARILGATDEPPRLLVLNSCESLAGANDLLQTVPTVIAMSDSIDDASAVIFAGQFYSAVGSAQSVASALEQAKTVMEVSSLEGSHLPEARTREGVDLRDLVLVNPPNNPL